jgi:uncharacterized membrane protein
MTNVQPNAVEHDKLIPREAIVPLPMGPATRSEFITLLAHFHRAEVARMAGWRDRLDRTTNWSITVIAAMLSVAFTTQQGHGLLVFAMFLILFLMLIESRRYRFYDVFRRRVRVLERNYYSNIFSRIDPASGGWLDALSHDLRKPMFAIDLRYAIAKRLRRNYIWMFCLLLVAWLIRVFSEGSARDMFLDAGGLYNHWSAAAAIGPFQGWYVTAIICLLYGWLIFELVSHDALSEELLEGNAHV